MTFLTVSRQELKPTFRIAQGECVVLHRLFMLFDLERVLRGVIRTSKFKLYDFHLSDDHHVKVSRIPMVM